MFDGTAPSGGAPAAWPDRGGRQRISLQRPRSQLLSSVAQRGVNSQRPTSSHGHQRDPHARRVDRLAESRP
jgi:hypothetical protein